MRSPNRVCFWALFLLATLPCWPILAGAAQQRPNPRMSPNQAAQTIKNPNRQSAQAQIKAAAAARAQSDPAYKVYLDALKAHDNQVKAFVQSRKRGAR